MSAPPRTLDDRAVRLFIGLAAFLCVNAVLAEFIGVKIFALEDTLGIAPLQWNLFGQTGSLSFTVGTLLWPFVFVLTDTINEFFGTRGVRFVSWVAVALIVYGFLFAYAAIQVAPAGWWVGAAQAQGVPDYQAAFAAIFGQGLWSIGGSIVAFLLGQVIDVAVFHHIRRRTGEKYVWLRATGSTAVSQLVDSFVVLYIAFVLGPQHWSMSRFLAISTVNYGYKMLAAVAMIPLLYLMRHAIRAYLGHALEERLRLEAAGG
ncbi:queuosine precursor transporter [Pseudoxanthomonas sp. X-1]|uniref:queuosine precursor transporter n=1 Tax=Pseudoxanthomonas sp. X-1 TaxID=2571115 RepID=UPI00110B6F29|nr:queuosine precursor transporter [Pseudoxanthomonas sp. X-1]TMN17155.1 VUT family protein [Pseudoxanthomonas sp. X-1]UAY76179.1 queuosine precursor transporter [Pseudoxanthomonas sp. X-1]